MAISNPYGLQGSQYGIEEYVKNMERRLQAVEKNENDLGKMCVDMRERLQKVEYAISPKEDVMPAPVVPIFDGKDVEKHLRDCGLGNQQNTAMRRLIERDTIRTIIAALSRFL